MSKKYTAEEFNELVQELGDERYQVLGVYKNVKTPVSMKHLECDTIFKPQPYEFINQGTRCPKCAHRSLSLGSEKFKERVKKITNNTYVVLGEYINNRKPILMRHNGCDQEFSPRPASFLAGTRCPYYSGRKSNATTFKKELRDLIGDEYILIGEYKNKNTKVNLLHKNCGQIYSAIPTCFLKVGYRCPKCVHKIAGKERRKSNEAFRTEMETKFSGQLIPLEEYVTGHHKILFKHVSCGEVFAAKPCAITSNNAGCPRCSQSMPETVIEGLLIDAKLNYKKQVKFDDCVGISGVKLPFDFVIYDKSNIIKMIIEYDGEQHYRPSFGDRCLEITQRNDQIKNKYCAESNLKLIRIPYWEKENIDFHIFNNL